MILWGDGPAYRYSFALGLHLVALGGLHFFQSQESKFLSSLLTRCKCFLKLKNSRILLGASLSVVNVFFTGLEIYFLVRILIRENLIQLFAVCSIVPRIQLQLWLLQVLI